MSSPIARLKQTVSAAYSQVDTALFGAAVQDLTSAGVTLDHCYRIARGGNPELDRNAFDDLVALSKDRGHIR